MLKLIPQETAKGKPTKAARATDWRRDGWSDESLEQL
jgi:hypothetical protein